MDFLIGQLDIALRSLCLPSHRQTTRPSPADKLHNVPRMSVPEQRTVASLLRVNHAGEVCAQALYQGQALTAQLGTVKTQMTQAALEEIDHLGWCEQRLRELDARPSRLNPLWYAGSLLLGAFAGCIGDRWSLGFVAETEQQVTAHLAQHLAQIPSHDVKTHAILLQMQHDEAQHADQALLAGGYPLPRWIQFSMRWMARVLTTTSRHI